MRQVIIEVADTFKNQSSTRINQWVNEVYQRTVVSSKSDVVFSLHDIQERVIGLAIKDAAEDFGLRFKTMREQTLILPVLDRRTDSLQPIVELLPGFFKSVLEETGKVKIERTGVIREGDVYVNSGSDELLEFTLSSDNKGAAPIAAVINFYVDGTPGHVLLNKKELENLKKAYLDIKFGGVNPLTNSEWDEIFISSVYRRMFSDASFGAGKLVIGDSSIELWKKAIISHNLFFKRQADADNLVRDRFGKVIGRTFKKYDALDVVKHEQQSKSVHTVQDNKVVSLDKKRDERITEKALENSAIDVPFDDMDIFDKSLRGESALSSFELFDTDTDGFLDSDDVDFLEEGELWNI